MTWDYIFIVNPTIDLESHLFTPIENTYRFIIVKTKIKKRIIL